MGIDDLVNQGKDFLEQNKDKIGEMLKSEQAEGVSDSALDAGAEFVKKLDAGRARRDGRQRPRQRRQGDRQRVAATDSERPGMRPGPLRCFSRRSQAVT